MQEKLLEGFRLSPQQKHLWLLQSQFDEPQRHKEHKGQAMPYRVQFGILMEGKLDIKALEIALQKAIDRHEILRTKFDCLPGMTIPLQVIDESYQLSIDECHLDDEEVEIDLFLEKVRRSIFSSESCLQVNLVTLASKKYLLIISLSALMADRISIEILLKEIADLYCHILEGKEIDESPMQYADIAEWQNELLANPDSELGKQYWQKQDFSYLRQSSLWFEDSQSDCLDFQPRFLTLKLAGNVAEKMQAIAHKNCVHRPDVLLAIWQVLLWKIIQQPNLIIATASDGRKYAELERSLGLLTKYLPLHFQLEKDLTFTDALQQANRLITEANEWQEYFNWEEIIEPDLPAADYPIGFEYQKVADKFDLAGISFSIYQQYACSERLKLKLTCLESSDRLIAEFHYDTGVFAAEDIANLAQQFETLLDSAIANPEVAIGELEILSESDRHRLLVEFNQTQADYPQDKCIHQLFEEWVERSPNSIAVVFENDRLTYQELNDRSDRLANYLQQLGVRAETLVAIWIERSLDAIVGILGILKAGAAYLPLDPAMPAVRLNLILEDSQPALLLTQPDLVTQFSQNTTPVISLSEVEDREFRNQLKTQNSTISVGVGEAFGEKSLLDRNKLSPECFAPTTLKNLAYVIYTSGSTGVPKGIAVEHRQLINYLYGILERLALPPGSSFATVSTFAADLGNTAIFPALCTGGCLHIIDRDTAMDAEALAAYCDSHPIDCLKIVPSHLAALLNSPFGKSILPRQRLVLGGEVATWDLIDRVRQLSDECQIINHYGPTETTVGVLTYAVASPDPRSTTVPIGKAIANTQIYILNEYLQPVAIGVPGEIYIGGASLARGYWQKLELTAEKFIQNPFLGTEIVGAQGLAPLQETWGNLLYKTGDLARYLPDGNIEFLGRIDNQIKIRGFRIELGEIEAVLEQHPDVVQAVVTVREDVQGDFQAGDNPKSDPPLPPLKKGGGIQNPKSNDKCLVAYLIPSQKPAPSISDLRSFLNSKLPDYMMPSVFVMLEAFPLTPNGKVDRSQLPAPDRVQKTFVAPRNDIEQKIAGIWSEVLSLDRVGIDDNFFDLGGHSLSATQIVSRLRQAFQIQLPLRYLFDFPTVADLGAIVAQKLAEQTDSEVLAQMLAELEELPEEEIKEVLAHQGGGKGNE
ncbi:MAG: amino acid adenylation domain-containing protein [Cyanosarcina radialis HA8281-LM2]|jgi:amino acid adenylation domain-containing protein|nr:amino acid adenylation domain-containing protein [Cyanosarcina radialis HA8281-LM2]